MAKKDPLRVVRFGRAGQGFFQNLDVVTFLNDLIVKRLLTRGCFFGDLSQVQPSFRGILDAMDGFQVATIGLVLHQLTLRA